MLEDYKLSDVLEDISREELRCLCLRYDSLPRQQLEARQTWTESLLSSLQGWSSLSDLAGHPAAPGEAEEQPELRGHSLTSNSLLL